MSAVVRLLPYAVSDGPLNMAADDLLLDAAEAGIASLRFYGWSEATLSLGYFQPAAPACSSPLLQSLPWLRRRSGGAALVHHVELTYALTLPADWVGPLATAPWIARIHSVVRDVLHQLGIDAHLCDREQRLGEILCFLHHTPGDLLLGAHKIAGSAQRKQRGALLQHGGILLAQSPHTPLLPGIAELAGQRLAPEPLQALLVDQLQRETGWKIEPGAWTTEEIAAQSQRAARYRDPVWNARR